MNLGKRLQIARIARGLTQKQLSELVPEVSQQRITALESRDSKSTENSVELAEGLEISLVWLLSGRGSMDDGQSDDEKRFVRLYSLPCPSSSAGDLIDYQRGIVASSISFSRQWLESLTGNTNLNDCGLYTVESEAMVETLRPGDVAIIDKSQTSYSTDGLYLIQIGRRYEPRRLQMMTNGSLSIIADNERYSSETLDPEQASKLETVAKVVRWLSIKA